MPFDFSAAIYSMLEKSCNLKLAAKRQEYLEEMETEMKLTGFKMKERVQRVINKIFDHEIELDDIFLDRADNSEDDEHNRPTQSKILQHSMVEIEEMCNLCT